MENKEQYQFLDKYLEFKQSCIEKNIATYDEIIKLFEVWLHL